MFLKYFYTLLNKFGYGFKRTTVGLFIMSVIGGFLELLGIAMIFPVILVLTSSESGGGKFILNLFLKFFPTSELKAAFILSLFMIGIFLFKNIFMMLYIKIQNNFAAKWTDYVNSIVVKKLLYSPYSMVSKLSYGDKDALLSTIVRDISLEFMLRCIILLANGVVALCIIGLLFYKFTLPAFLSTVFILVFAYLENNFFKKKAKTLGDIGVKLVSGLSGAVDFIIKSQKEIIISNKQDYFSKYLNTASKRISDNFSKRISYGNYPLYVTEIGVILAFLIMITTIVFANFSSKETILASLAIISLIILRLVPQLNKVLISMYAINVSKQKVIWFLEKYDEISKFEIENCNKVQKIEFKNEIKLSNLGFEYEKNKGIFDISLSIKKGEFIGIIGASGAGKTTLADIISGISLKKCGKFIVDNIEIDESNLYSYRSLVSLLPQESAFLDDTVLKNVAWGEDNIDEEKVKASLLMAGLNLDINSKMNLSSGQKKRVALARCYYGDFEILVLDEATASLDVESENTVIQNILKLKGEKTIIAIAHRLSTLKKCDRIIYLKDGKIKDIGTFLELKERNKEVEAMLQLSSFD